MVAAGGPVFSESLFCLFPSFVHLSVVWLHTGAVVHYDSAL